MNNKGIIYLLAFGLFVMVTAEMVVAGILVMIAQDMNVSISIAGQLVTVFAFVIAFVSPILLSLTSKMERKKLLLFSFFVFVVGNLFAFFSPNFTILMASRIIQAASVGVFAVVALTVGSSLVAPERQGNAIGIIIMGASAALVVGVPLGTLVGEYLEWRFVFLLIGILSIFSMIAIAVSVPKLESQESVSLKTQLAALRDRRIMSGLFITLFWSAGFQLIFPYITPFLQEAANLNISQISVALFISGIFAVVGSRIGGYSTDRWGVYRTLLVSLLLHAVALMILPWVATTFAGALIILAVWIGSGYMTTPAQQYYLVSLSPTSSGLALGLNNSIQQLGIAVGAGTGGWLLNYTSIMNLGWIGAISILVGLLAVLYSFSLKDKQLEEIS